MSIWICSGERTPLACWSPRLAATFSIGEPPIATPGPGVLPCTSGSVLAYFFAAQLFQLVENWAENVGLVIRSRSRKIGEILCALNDCYGALETHSGIDVARCQRDIFGMAGVTAAGYRLRVELDENQIPNFDAARIIFVHERATGVAVRRQIRRALPSTDHTGRCRPSSRNCRLSRCLERELLDRDRLREINVPSDRTPPGRTRWAR